MVEFKQSIVPEPVKEVIAAAQMLQLIPSQPLISLAASSQIIYRHSSCFWGAQATYLHIRSFK